MSLLIVALSQLKVVSPSFNITAPAIVCKEVAESMYLFRRVLPCTICISLVVSEEMPGEELCAFKPVKPTTKIKKNGNSFITGVAFNIANL